LKRLGVAFVVILGLPLVAILGFVVWAWTEDRPADGSSTKEFRIPTGEPLGLTAQRLADERLIRNPMVFRLVYQLSRGDGSVPSGTFSVPGGMSARQAVEYLQHAQPLQVRVTIPEGWTATKIARLLEEKHVVLAADFLAIVRDPSRLGALGTGLTTLDGRLFPETYMFPIDSPGEEVARTFLQTFRKRTAPWEASFSPEERDRRIILASIVEREYRNPDEAPLIASVLHNRLKKGIPLGSCATIEYILTEIQGRPHPHRIFFVHTEIPSPYNTYLHKGLPPSAICNPGMTALKAVFEPVESDYLYFVVADSKKGTHTFSSNFAGHLKAREAYLNSFVTKG